MSYGAVLAKPLTQKLADLGLVDCGEAGLRVEELFQCGEPIARTIGPSTKPARTRVDVTLMVAMSVTLKFPHVVLVAAAASNLLRRP